MNIYIGEPVVVSDMQGPCPDGFHVPLFNEWTGLKTIMTGLSLTTGNNWKINLHLPLSGMRDNLGGTVSSQGSVGFYRSSSYNSTNVSGLALDSSSVVINNNLARSSGCSIRPFKNKFVTPTSNWTVITGRIGSAGIFWNQTDGIISITSNGTTGYTIQDKNLGATSVYNNGDTLTQANMGNMYQRGNNYGFPSTGSVTTSSTRVNASSYGPGNYYTGSTFITTGSSPYNWSNPANNNLRGGVSQGSGTKSVEVKNIYIGDVRIYKGEYIEYKMNADSSGYLYVPLSGINTSGTQSCSYSWKVSIDGGAETTYSGTGSSGESIALSGYTSGSSHTIKITPTTEDYGWARAYGWLSTPGATYLTEIVYDSSYMGYAVSATDTGAYFRCFEYRGCTNIIAPAEEYLPDTVTTIGVSFRSQQYLGCTSLTYAIEEVLPSSVTSIGTHYRATQYQGCTALTEIKGWKDLSIGNSNYRTQQFYNCTSNKTVKVLNNVGYNSYSQITLQNDYVTSVYVPSAYLTNFKNSSNYPWTGITDSKFIGY